MATMNPGALLRRVKARVPMFRLFTKISLWFWLTAWTMLSIVLISTHFAGIRVVSPPNMYATVAPVLAAEAVRTYETGGAQAFARFSQSNIEDRRIYLLDGFNRDVLGRPISSEGMRVAHAAKNGQLVVLRYNIAAYKFISTSGHPYILMLYMKSGVDELESMLFRDGLPFTLFVIFLVTLLCFLFAYHIASPIHGIQLAARRVAQGDLKARVPASVSKRHDELAALAKDFDSMVERIGILLQTQKDLLQSVSHELRSPLARLNLSLTLLRKQSPEQSEDMLQRMERDVSRIDLLMGQLLTLSRLEAGLSSGERGEVDFAQLVEEVAADASFEAQALDKLVSLHSVDSAVIANADPHALRSACENIVRNAIRFTPPGGSVDIRLEVEREPLPPCAVLSVRDHGPGVPEESLQTIFQPFFRINLNGETSGGNGLGLAIAFQAIRLHHGMISASNRSPTGLAITVRLPISAYREPHKQNELTLEHTAS